MSIFVDTSAFYAIIDNTDKQHDTAVSTWQKLLGNSEELVTSSYVLSEMIALLHGRFGTATVRRFVKDNLPAVKIEWVSFELYFSALGSMLAIPGKSGPSLTDCVNL